MNPRAQVEDFVRLKDEIAQCIRLETDRGLEVGPFDRPFFLKSETQVEYLDYRDTADLRAFAAIAPGHSPDFVPEMDYVVPGSGEWTAVPDGVFDWILSSHALEHSPNLIEFLRTMSTKLRPGGLIISLLPDKRRTFDAYRPLTTLGKIFEDFITQAKRPSFQAAFDNIYYGRSLSCETAEAAHAYSGLDIVEGADLTQSLMVGKSALHHYVDVHNYVFTDSSFKAIAKAICETNYVNLDLVTHTPTRDGEMTFVNVMRKRVPQPFHA